MFNSRLKIKVCGLRDNILEVDAVQPDFIGFIFYPKSPRYVGYDFVMPPALAALKVGVFVNQPIRQVMEIQRKHDLDYLQLHGDENVDYCVELKAHALKIIKVFAGNQMPLREDLDNYAPFIDYYLFDTKLAQHGGNGISFDWSVLHNLNLKKPIILSGGISLANVKELDSLADKIYAIDVNSKFETSPGLKNINQIKELKSTIS